MAFSRQEYWSELSFPPPGDLPDPGIEPRSLVSPASAADSFPLAPPEKPECGKVESYRARFKLHLDYLQGIRSWTSNLTLQTLIFSFITWFVMDIYIGICFLFASLLRWSLIKSHSFLSTRLYKPLSLNLDWSCNSLLTSRIHGRDSMTSEARPWETLQLPLRSLGTSPGWEECCHTGYPTTRRLPCLEEAQTSLWRRPRERRKA